VTNSPVSNPIKAFKKRIPEKLSIRKYTKKYSLEVSVEAGGLSSSRLGVGGKFNRCMLRI
jgi:hypothetical protein